METKCLSNAEVTRYSRQMILPGFGVSGQLSLKESSVLIVGAGGLGCPCALYLAAAGVGHLGLVDYDVVELSNLHRQILHKETAVDTDKVMSATTALHTVNSTVKVSPLHIELNKTNALDLIKGFDVIVDATDNVATRYLLNDACFLSKRPLVSGSALQMEGQLTVYQHDGAPCYRCLFPIPPPPEAVTSCGEGGVLGVIPGTIGVLQALQVINIILKKPTLAGCLLLFDGMNCSFRHVKLRSKRPDCQLCGDTPTITSLIDYEAFCRSKANDKNPDLRLLEGDARLSATEYSVLQNRPHLLMDVRSSAEFEMCHIPGSVNVPIHSFEVGKMGELVTSLLKDLDPVAPVFVVCRRGNDSQKAVLALKTAFQDRSIRDIEGGLHAWARQVDPLFPVY